MTRFRRRHPPIVVPPIGELHRPLQQLRRRRIVQRAQLDGDKVTAQLLDMSAAEWANAAMLAEQVMHAPGAELVVAQIGFAGEQTEIGGLDGHAPIARFRANRTVALARPGTQIEIGFVAHRAAMTTAVVGLLHAFAPG